MSSSRLAPFGLAALALAAASLATPAAAQVTVGNPDAANASFAHQSEMRSLQIQGTTQANTLRMDAQRSVQYAPSPVGILPPYLARRALGRGATVRAGRGGTLNTSICTGC